MTTISNNMNNYRISNDGVSFQAEREPSKIPVITKPIDKVEDIVNSTVDVFVPEAKDEETKKSHKKMIRVGSTVLVLSSFVLLLNPKFSSNLVKRLKTKSTTAADKAKIDNSFTGYLSRIKEGFYKTLTGAVQVINNGNSTKDTLFQKLCSKTDVTKKAHGCITKWFDSISKRTVFSTYGKASNKMNVLEDILNRYKTKIPEADRKIIEAKLREIRTTQEYFNSTNTAERLSRQEELMKDLEKDVTERIKTYKDGLFKKDGNRKDILNFWAEESLMPQRNKLEEEGKEVLEKLIGDGETKKGAYREILEILTPHLKNEEKAAIEEQINSTAKFLRKANKTECIEYFDKKRDLMLGSAPTDVVTALLSLIASGVAIGAADTKDDRISRALSGAFPVVAGLGVSTALTALLYSGGKGMMIGSAFSMLLSGIGSGISRIIYPNKNIAKDSTEDDKSVKKEVVYA